jgi:hypothetical protein
MIGLASPLLVGAGVVGGLLFAAYTGTASAKDPEPQAGMHEACDKMDHEGMAQMHDGGGMHGDSEDMGPGGMEGMHGEMHQGMDEMRGGGMHGESEDGESMPPGMPGMQ